MRSIRSLFFSLLLACALLASFLLLRPFSVSEAGQTVPSAISTNAAAAVGEVAYVTLRDSNLVALVDTASQSTLGTVDVGAAGCFLPWRAAMSPDGSHVYVSCYSSGTVAVIETTSNSVVALIGDSLSLTMTPTVISTATPIATPTATPSVTPSSFDNEDNEPAGGGGGGIPSADGIAFTRDGAYALVGSRWSSQIAVIDTTTYQITQFIATPANARSVVVHPALDVAYATSGDGSILVIDTSSFTIISTISVADEPWDVAVSPDGEWVFAGDRWGAGLTVIATGSNTVHTTVTGLGELTGLEVAPDGSQIYASGLSNGLHVIDGESFTHLTTISNIGQAWEVAATCDGSELYVGNTESEVPVIDTETLSVTTQIGLSGFGARGIAICPQVRLPGVYVHPSAQSAFDTPGSHLLYEEYLVNATGQSDAFDLSLADNSWQTTLSLTNTGVLSDGASISFTVQVTIPEGTEPGEMDTLTVEAASVTSPTLYSDTATITSAALCEPNLVFGGESGQVQGGLDDYYDYGGQTFAYLNIYGYSLDNNALNATVSGYDANSGTWQTIAEQVNGNSGVIASQLLLPSAFTQIRVQLDSLEFEENLISYDYQFILCRQPAVDVSPNSQQDFVLPGVTALYTQTVTNYMMASDSFDLTASGNQWATTFWQGSTPITNTGLLADEERFTFTVKVEVPVDATPGISDTVMIDATSVMSPTISDSATIETLAIGDLAYITLSDSNLVALVDTASQVSVGSIDVGAAGCLFPWRAAMSPDRAYVYVSCLYSGAVAVIETASNSVVTLIGENSTPTPTPTPTSTAFPTATSTAFPPATPTAFPPATSTAFPTATPTAPPPPFLRGEGQGQERREGSSEETISNDDHEYLSASEEAKASAGGGGIPSADGLAFTRDGAHALVGSRWSSQIAVIDTTSREITALIPTDAHVRSLVTHPYLDLAYATSGDGNILTIDTTTFTLMASIPVGGEPWDVAISPDGTWIFASDRRGAGLAVVAVGSNSVHTRVTGLGDLTGLDVAPDGSKIYVGGLWQGVHVIDGESFSHLTTIFSSGQAWEVATTCDGSQLYVGNTDNFVPVIDTEALDVFADVPMPGLTARGIAICPPSQEPGLHLYPMLQSGYDTPGSSLIYDEYIVNATGQTDSFDLSLANNSWESDLSISNTGPLADGASLSFTVEVAIPSDAEAGAEDSVTLEAASVTSPALYLESATINTTALCSPNLVFAGQSEGENQLDDIYEYGTQTFAYLYVYGYSLYNNALNATVEGYDPQSATWQTIAEQVNSSSGLIASQLLLPPTFTQIRVQLDSFQGNLISYDYEFTVCREPTVDLSPALQEDFVSAGTTAVYSQTVTNYMMAPDSFDLTVSGNQWATTFWDGETPITNTGLLADEESFTFTVKVEVPAEESPGGSDTATIEATSQMSDAVSDSASLHTGIIGELAYITLSNSDLVALVDTASQAVVESINVGAAGCSFPWRATMSPDGAHVYVSCRYSGAVVVIETASNSIVATVGGNPTVTVTPTFFATFTPAPSVTPTATPTATPPATPTPFLRGGTEAMAQEERLHPRRDGSREEAQGGGGAIPDADGITFSRDGAYAFVGSRFNNEIAIIDTTTYNLNFFIVSPANVRSLASHPYLDLVYATSGDGKLLVIDSSTFAITTAIPVGTDPWDVAISPNGDFVFVSDRQGAGLAVIETSSNTVHTTVTDLGEALTGLDVAPDGSKIYVGGLWDGVHVIDGETFSHISTITDLGRAWEVAATCDGEGLYVGNTDSFVPVIETDTFSVTAQIDMPGFGARGITICPQPAEMAIEELMASNDSPTTLGESTIFSATIDSGTNVSYNWDFGDGESGTGASVEHTYTQAGSYTAVVSATNLLGTVTDSTSVQIVALTATPTQTASPTATGTATATATSTSVPTATATSTSVATVTATSTSVATATATSTSVPTATATATATSTSTSTPMPTSTPTVADGAVAVEIMPDSATTLTFMDQEGNNTIIEVPEGAVNQPTRLLFTPTTAGSSPSNYILTGHAFMLDAYQEGVLLDNFVFLQPITITIHYSDSDVAKLDEESLLLFYWNEQAEQWQDAASSCNPASSYDYHADENWLTVELCHLTEFSLFGEGEDILYLPIIQR